MTDPVSIRERALCDEAEVAAFLAERHSARVARLGRVEHPMEHPALVAERGGRLADCEILTLHAGERWRGAGTALLGAVEERAASRGCRRLWLLTTNDNVDALRFYQRRGFRLAELRAGAVDASRELLKPEIPRTGEYGIPLRDELILEKEVEP